MDSDTNETPKIKAATCPNCGHSSSLSDEYKFCPSCGQDGKDKRVTVWSLFREAFANLFNLDNKLWQTTFNLFVPGKLTKEFFKGRRQRYVSPLRIFLITALAFFAVVQTFTIEQADVFIDEMADSHKKDLHYGVFLEQLGLETDTLLQGDRFSEAALALDSLEKRMHRSYSDSTMIGVVNIFSSLDSLSELTIARKDLATLSQDSLVQIYGNGNFWDDLLLRQNLRLAEKGENFLSHFLGQLVWMMLIMMPFLALFLKLIYIRRGFYYVDHLIFSFHTHAFVFLIFSISLLFNSYLQSSEFFGSIRNITLLVVIVYLFIAQKRVYRQSGSKTFLKFILVNIFYFILFLIALLFTSIIALLLF